MYDDFLAAIQRAVDTRDARRVDIDLGDVQFLDCNGIHALLKGRELAEGKHIGYTVCNIKTWIHSIMDVLGVVPVLLPQRAQPHLRPSSIHPRQS